MVDELIDLERKKYTKMWEFDSYRERSPGLRHLNDALIKLMPEDGASFVDLGSGTGRVSNELQSMGFDVTAVDIAENSNKEFNGKFICASITNLPKDLGFFDYGFCADVMEHLPTHRVNQALKNIAEHSKETYFQIANFHCHEGDKIGEALHLTVKKYRWWLDVLIKYFEVTSGEEAKKHHLFVCKSLVF